MNTAFAGISAVGKQHNIKFTNRNLQLKWLEQEKGRGCKAFRLDSRKCLHWFLRNSEKWPEKQSFILHDWTSLTRLLRNAYLILSFWKLIQSCCNNKFWFWWIVNKTKWLWASITQPVLCVTLASKSMVTPQKKCSLEDLWGFFLPLTGA